MSFVTGPALRPQASRRVARPARGGALDMRVLEVGDHVMAWFRDDKSWYPGRLTEKIDDENYVVTWDDPDGAEPTQRVGLRDIQKKYYYTDYQVGDDCRARSPDDERWYPGVVAELLGDDKFRVRWNDPGGGDETTDMNFESMRKVDIKKDYEVGDKVAAKHEGEWREAEVTGANDDGSFQVKLENSEDSDDSEEVEEISADITDLRPRRKPIEEVKVGEKYQGVVEHVMKNYAFVDIGATESAMLHVSHILPGVEPKQIRDHLAERQEVTVWVCDVQVIGPGMIQETIARVSMVEGAVPNDDGDVEPFQDVSSDEWFDGKVARIFSARNVKVQIKLPSGEAACGALHSARCKADFRDFKHGQSIRVRIESVNVEEGRLSLSTLEPGEIPEGFGDPSSFEGVDSSQFLDGEVQGVGRPGVFVAVRHPDTGATAKGLCRNPNVKGDPRGYTAGQQVKVRVVDVTGWKVALSMRSEAEEADDEQPDV